MAGRALQASAPGPADEIERVLARLESLWDHDEPAVPPWAAQELTFGQLRLLFLLRRADGAAMSRIAEWLDVGLPAASGVIDRLERHGLVARRHRSDDRRIVECHLTDAGRRLIDEIAGMRSETLRRILRVLADDELSTLDGLLKAVIDRTQAHPEARAWRISSE